MRDVPFKDESPGYVPLSSAPLINSLAQIRFPAFSAFAADEDGHARGVAAALSSRYPLIEVGQQLQVTITPDGVSQAPGGARLWKRRADRLWSVSFGTTFLSIETSAYTRRSEFAERLAEAWGAFTERARPPFVDRLGVRYVNRLEQPHLERLPDLVRHEVLGLLSAPAGDGVAVSGVSEFQYQLPSNTGLQVRCGLLPPGVGLDPTMAPAAGPSWLLDLDAFRTWQAADQYAADDIDEFNEGKLSALRAYQFFRWAVSDEFLRTFGAETP